MGLATLTLVLAAYLFVDGVFEIIYAFRLRPIKGWGWTLFAGSSMASLSRAARSAAKDTQAV